MFGTTVTSGSNGEPAALTRQISGAASRLCVSVLTQPAFDLFDDICRNNGVEHSLPSGACDPAVTCVFALTQSAIKCVGTTLRPMQLHSRTNGDRG